MIKYAKVINNLSGLCETAEGSNIDFYKSIGMTQLDVEQSEKDNNWYLASKCPHYTPEEKAQQREADFNKQFFNTSLGYIRRSVTMADGSKKDFLSDLLLQIKAGIELGQEVNIITYKLPDFYQEITEDYMISLQEKKPVTLAFIAECLSRTALDFGF